MLNELAAFADEYGELLIRAQADIIVRREPVSYVIGLALGVVLYLTAPGSLWAHKTRCWAGWSTSAARSRSSC